MEKKILTVSKLKLNKLLHSSSISLSTAYFSTHFRIPPMRHLLITLLIYIRTSMNIHNINYVTEK